MGLGVISNYAGGGGDFGSSREIMTSSTTTHQRENPPKHHTALAGDFMLAPRRFPKLLLGSGVTMVRFADNRLPATRLRS